MAKTTNADHRPEVIEDLGDGTYHYNFDIDKSIDIDDEGNSSESWNYNQVRLPYPIDIEKIKVELVKKGFKHETAFEFQGLTY